MVLDILLSIVGFAITIIGIIYSQLQDRLMIVKMQRVLSKLAVISLVIIIVKIIGAFL